MLLVLTVVPRTVWQKGLVPVTTGLPGTLVSTHTHVSCGGGIRAGGMAGMVKQSNDGGRP